MKYDTGFSAVEATGLARISLKAIYILIDIGKRLRLTHHFDIGTDVPENKTLDHAFGADMIRIMIHKVVCDVTSFVGLIYPYYIVTLTHAIALFMYTGFKSES